MDMSTYLKNKLINHTLRSVSYIAPTHVYVALYSSDPTDADTGTELTGNGYARIQFTVVAPTDGVTSNDADIVSPIATADWLPITHIGIRDSSSTGNLLYHKALTTSVTVVSSNNLRIPTSSLNITLA